MNTIKLLGIDPGKTTGWAQAELDVATRVIKPLNFGDSTDPTGLELLEMMKESDYIIVENFLVDPRYARSGAFDYDSMIAPQVIGSIRTLAAQIGKENQIAMQPSSVKPVGYAWLGKKYKKGKKGMHRWDALAHIYYYAVKNLRALPNQNVPSQPDLDTV